MFAVGEKVPVQVMPPLVEVIAESEPFSTVISSGLSQPAAIALDPDGNIYVANIENLYVIKYLILSGTSVNLNVNPNCYIINSYDGIKVNYLYNSEVNPTINQVFVTSADCAINFYNTVI